MMLEHQKQGDKMKITFEVNESSIVVSGEANDLKAVQLLVETQNSRFDGARPPNTENIVLTCLLTLIWAMGSKIRKTGVEDGKLTIVPE